MVKNLPKRTLSIINLNVFGAPFHAQRVLRTLFTTSVYPRFDYLGKMFNTSGADIITLQEVNTYRQLFYIRKRMTNYPYHYYKRYLQGPRGGLVIFSKIPIENVTYTTFKKTGVYWNKSFIAHLLRRGMLVGDVKGMPVTIVNTHLTHNLEHDWSNKASIRSIHDIQIAQVQELLEQKHITKRAMLVMGDFNIPHDSELFLTFLKNTKVIDVFNGNHGSTYHEEYTFKEIPLGRIDHMFLLENKIDIKIVEKKHVLDKKVTLSNGKESYLSDHIGLYAKFNF